MLSRCLPRRHGVQEHYQAAKKTETHPDEGAWPAYPSGKSHDEAGTGLGEDSRGPFLGLED